jgi:hypothetical protein
MYIHEIIHDWKKEFELRNKQRQYVFFKERTWRRKGAFARLKRTLCFAELGSYLGAPCELTCDPKLSNVVCDQITRHCKCEKKFPVKLGAKKGCAKREYCIAIRLCCNVAGEASNICTLLVAQFSDQFLYLITTCINSRSVTFVRCVTLNNLIGAIKEVPYRICSCVCDLSAYKFMDA